MRSRLLEPSHRLGRFGDTKFWAGSEATYKRIYPCLELVSLPSVALPNRLYLPAHTLQRSRSTGIALDVAGQLRFPVFIAALRLGSEAAA